MQSEIKILGGGIGGLCTALACQREGLSFTLYEKQPQINYREVGLGISRNIFPLLAHWDVLEEATGLGVEISNFLFVNKKLNVIRKLRMKAPALSVNRRKFHQLLYARLQKEHVQLHTQLDFTDSSPEQIIVAADGADSSTRQAIYPQIKLRNSHQLLWRGAVAIDLPPAFHHSYYDFVGGNLRFAIIHGGGNMFFWYAVEAPGESLSAQVDIKQRLLRLYQEYHPLVLQIIQASEHIYPDWLQDIDPSQRKGLPWHKQNLVFVGDAIHATTPNMANGACLAMEDAYVLVKLLKSYPHNPQTAFYTYQSLREKKVNRIVSQSWLLGKMLHQKNKVIDFAIQQSNRLMPQWGFDMIYSQVLDNSSIRKADEIKPQ